jgi:hypothetical protein
VWNVHIPLNGTGEQHIGILKNFVGAITRGEPLIAPAVEGIHSVELANAMLLSSFRDAPVTLPMDSATYAAELKKKIAESRFSKKVTSPVVASADTFSKSF